MVGRRRVCALHHRGCRDQTEQPTVATVPGGRSAAIGDGREGRIVRPGPGADQGSSVVCLLLAKHRHLGPANLARLRSEGGLPSGLAPGEGAQVRPGAPRRRALFADQQGRQKLPSGECPSCRTRAVDRGNCASRRRAAQGPGGVPRSPGGGRTEGGADPPANPEQELNPLGGGRLSGTSLFSPRDRHPGAGSQGFSAYLPIDGHASGRLRLRPGHRSSYVAETHPGSRGV